LYQNHVAAGARIVPFAGWEMPVQCGSILDEVRAVRQSAGIFDVSHMGQVRVLGAGSLSAVQRLFTNNAAALTPGRAQYSLMCQPDGGILDDLIVYRWDDGAAEPDYLIVVNASNRETDYAWMVEHSCGEDCTLADLSDDFALLAVQGPQAVGIVQGLAPAADLAGIPAFSHAAATLIDGTPVHVARTGYTGEDGFEIFCAWDAAPAVWDSVVAAGAAPCGLGARDVLRIEACYPLYGHEINTSTVPYQAGLGWVVKPKKGDFIGRDAMLAARAAGLPRLRGLLPDDPRAIPREGAPVRHPDGDGTVTSGTFSPTLNRAIAMGYLPASAEGEATLPMRGREYAARIVDLPFYKRGS
jgi:aminomethyltransferase